MSEVYPRMVYEAPDFTPEERQRVLSGQPLEGCIEIVIDTTSGGQKHDDDDWEYNGRKCGCEICLTYVYFRQRDRLMEAMHKYTDYEPEMFLACSDCMKMPAESIKNPNGKRETLTVRLFTLYVWLHRDKSLSQANAAEFTQKLQEYARINSKRLAKLKKQTNRIPWSWVAIL